MSEYSDNNDNKKNSFKYKNTKHILNIINDLKSLNGSFLEHIDFQADKLKLSSRYSGKYSLHTSSTNSSYLNQRYSKYNQLRENYNSKVHKSMIIDQYTHTKSNKQNKNIVLKSLDNDYELRNNNFINNESNNQVIIKTNNSFNVTNKSNVTDDKYLSKHTSNGEDKGKLKSEKSNQSPKANIMKMIRENDPLKSSLKMQSNFYNDMSFIENYMSNYFIKNKYFIEKYLEVNWVKFCSYDTKRNTCTLMTKQSLYLYLCKYFHPASTSIILTVFKLTGHITKENYINIVLKAISEWNYDKIIKFCFEIFNPNQVGDIDINDLMTILKSAYCYDRTNYFWTDIIKMMKFLEISIEESNKLMENEPNLPILKEVNKIINRDIDILKIPEFKRSRKDKIILETELIDQIQVINYNVNSKYHNQIGINDFYNIEWNKIAGTEFKIPEIYFVFIKVMCGLDLKINLKNIGETKSYISPKIYDLSDSYKDFEIICKKSELNHEECLIGLISGKDYNYYESHPSWFNIVESFYSFTDKTNRITLESFTNKVETLIGLRNLDKLSSVLFNIISEGYPLNLYKYIHFLDMYYNSNFLFLFKLMQIDNDESVNLYDVEIIKESFKGYTMLLIDCEKLENCMTTYNINKIYSIIKFEGYIGFKSYIQNFIFMMLQGDVDYKDYGMREFHTKTIKEKNQKIINFTKF